MQTLPYNGMETHLQMKSRQLHLFIMYSIHALVYSGIPVQQNAHDHFEFLALYNALIKIP